MALKGNLADFNILNILQMIKLEGKTGRLTLSHKEDLVKITFDRGFIIYAESTPAFDESRIKETLLAARVINEHAWDVIKKAHDDSLRPYWELLSKNANSQKMILELIKRQTVDNVYYALRWKKGEYEFALMKDIKYNNTLMVPMDVDALLMEGCRIADEMPTMLKQAPKLDEFLVKNVFGQEDIDEGSKNAIAVTGAEWANGLERQILHSRGVALTNGDLAMLSVVGTGKTVLDIMRAARQGQFDTVQSINRMVRQGVLKVGKKAVEGRAAKSTGMVTWLAVVVILVAICGGGFFWRITMFEPAARAKMQKAADQYGVIEAKADLKRIRSALSSYIALKGQLPETLTVLSAAKAISQAELIDPWDRPYVFAVIKEQYALYSAGPNSWLLADDVTLADSPTKEDTAEVDERAAIK
jgi:hypothetical protein